MKEKTKQKKESKNKSHKKKDRSGSIVKVKFSTEVLNHHNQEEVKRLFNQTFLKFSKLSVPIKGIIENIINSDIDLENLCTSLIRAGDHDGPLFAGLIFNFDFYKESTLFRKISNIAQKEIPDFSSHNYSIGLKASLVAEHDPKITSLIFLQFVEQLEKLKSYNHDRKVIHITTVYKSVEKKDFIFNCMSEEKLSQISYNLVLETSSEKIKNTESGESFEFLIIAFILDLKKYISFCFDYLKLNSFIN